MIWKIKWQNVQADLDSSTAPKERDEDNQGWDHQQDVDGRGVDFNIETVCDLRCNILSLANSERLSQIW